MVDDPLGEGEDAAAQLAALRASQGRRQALIELADRFRDCTDTAEMAYAAAEITGQALGVSRAGYGVIDPEAETISIERDWNAPGIDSIAGVLQFRDFGSYIEDLKQGETAIVADAADDPRTRATAAALKAISAQAFINMPLFEHGRFVALFYLNHAEPRAWAQEEVEFMRNVADRTRSAVERLRAEQQLRALNASLEAEVAERTRRYDQAWRNSQDLMVVVDAAGVFHAANPAWTRHLGWLPEEVVGHNFREFIHPDDDLGTEGALETATQEALRNFQNRYRHRDGSYRWFAWTASPEGELVYGNGRDITLEKEQATALAEAEAKLRQALKMEAVGQLTGGIAHDFNNLLQGITGSLDMIQRRIAKGRLDDLDRFVGAATTSAARASALTHRLLAFSRRQPLDPRTVAINPLVSSMEDMLARTLGEGIELVLALDDGLWGALCDQNQLESAVLNLAINARDAMPDGGRLTIETTNAVLDAAYAARTADVRPGDYVCISVSDTGEGMTPDVVARAFEPFFTTKPIGQGTGLGLSMIYGFARQSEGHAQIYSELGMGTTVRLYLPRHSGDAGATEAGGGPSQDASAREGETVLVVEDEAVVRGLVVEVLSDLGYRVLEATDGQEGLAVLTSDARIDLLVTDIGLPGVNGRQLADAGRLHRPGLKVLFMTGYAETAAIASGFLAPGMALITKPFALEMLATRVREILWA